MMWGYHGFGPGAGFFGGGLMMLVWPLLLVCLVVLLVRLARGHSALACCGGSHLHHIGAQPSEPDAAHEVARQRYARGEITRDEYLDIRQTLGR